MECIVVEMQVVAAGAYRRCPPPPRGALQTRHHRPC